VVIGFVLVFFIHHFNFILKNLVKSLVTLPLVLPPSVLGYYLLVSFQQNALLGSWFEVIFNVQLAFSFEGILLGSVIFSLPFMVNPILSALDNLPASLEEASKSIKALTDVEGFDAHYKSIDIRLK